MKKLVKTLLAVTMTAVFLLSTLVLAFADEKHGDYATSGEMAQVTDVDKYGMTPIAGSLIKDGTWDIEVETSSQFFVVEKCQLIVKNGEMTAKMTMSTYSYTLLYLGTAEDAAAAPEEDYIDFERIDDYYVFTVPVEALNKGIDCSAYSKAKKKWYYREILFDASTLPSEALNGMTIPNYDLIEEAVEAYDGNSDTEDAQNVGTQADNPKYNEPMTVDLEDGEYSINVSMTGGSGRATISTPTLMIVKDGKAYAQLLWSSTYYDWMKVGGVTYENETTDGGNSTFTIPISTMDYNIPVVADTTAMGDAVAIDYTLTFYRESIGGKSLIPQEATKRVVIVAVAVIIGGFILNFGTKKFKVYRAKKKQTK